MRTIRIVEESIMNTYQLRQYKQSGEVFACHLESMTMGDMLHYTEQVGDLDGYALDNEMTEADIANSVVLREEARNA